MTRLATKGAPLLESVLSRLGEAEDALADFLSIERRWSQYGQSGEVHREVAREIEPILEEIGGLRAKLKRCRFRP